MITNRHTTAFLEDRLRLSEQALAELQVGARKDDWEYYPILIEYNKKEIERYE